MAVYTTGVTRSDLGGAAQIALVMLVIVIGLHLLERHGRQRQRFLGTQRMRLLQVTLLGGTRAVLSLVLGALPVIIGFAAPAAYLVAETFKRLHFMGGTSAHLLSALLNTLAVATAATILTLLCGPVVAWAARTPSSGNGHAFDFPRACVRIEGLGYAAPGIVLATDFLSPLLMIDSA